MKKILITILALIFSSVFSISLPQSQEYNEYYKQGIAALNNKETDKAIKSFKNSVREFSDANSCFELAKIYSDKNTPEDRTLAREYLQQAIWKEPDNIKYRLMMAKLMEYISSGLAFGVYEDILNIDSTNAVSWYNMGRIEEEEFDDYHNSINKEEDEPALSLEKFAQGDFNEAESYFKKALFYDPQNKNALLHLSFLYEDNGEPGKGVPLLEKLVGFYPDDMQGHLYLGLLYYKTSKMEKAFTEYQNALLLMSYDQRQDFTYNSVKELLQPIFGDDLKNFSTDEIKEIIKKFWESDDPLYLTKYNERLLEHYSRVAYANLRFSVPEFGVPTPPGRKKIIGWQTDRGEVVLRYGEPEERIRYRPYINAGGRTEVRMKTDVWNYKDMTFGFTDDYMSGNFTLSIPFAGSRYQPQFPYDSYAYADYVRRERFEYYTPKFEGPAFKVPYDIVQFKNLNKNNYTDVYVNYGIPVKDSLIKNDNYDYAFKEGLFLFDKYIDEVYGKRDTVAFIPLNRKLYIPDSADIAVCATEMTVKPVMGKLAFELIRSSDRGVSSHHLKFFVKSFKTSSLSISDIILASNISPGTDSVGTDIIRRGNTKIFPNPTNIFSKSMNMFIYYEIYNLGKNDDNLTDFVQNISLRRKDDRSDFSKTLSSAFGGLLKVFGVGNNKKEITLSTVYQTKEINPQMYLQLDMSNYVPGEYILTVSITDKVTGKSVKSEKLVNWR
jgi:GWxTD domain-containing protein